MNEKELVAVLVDHLSKSLQRDGIGAASFKNIYHSLTVDTQGEVRTDEGDRGISRRGRAFQVDILIFEKAGLREIPRVALEVKANRITTHQVLQYSAKARQHKNVYPYLRYGLLISGLGGNIPPRVVFHGKWFDFTYAAFASELSGDELEELAQIVRHEVTASRFLGEYLFDTSRGRPSSRMIWKKLEYT